MRNIKVIQVFFLRRSPATGAPCIKFFFTNLDGKYRLGIGGNQCMGLARAVYQAKLRQFVFCLIFKICPTKKYKIKIVNRHKEGLFLHQQKIQINLSLNFT